MHDPTECFGGVDWATDGHAVAVVDSTGRAVVEFDVTHTADGLNELCRRLATATVRRVAIERPDGPVVEALLEIGLEVVVVSSRAVKARRTRYGTAGNKCDRSDAYVLADCLRTDGHRWRSLEPDSPATVTLRSHVRPARTSSRPRRRRQPAARPSARHLSRRRRAVPAHRQPDQPALLGAVPVDHPSQVAVDQAAHRLAGCERRLRPQGPHRALCPPAACRTRPRRRRGEPAAPSPSPSSTSSKRSEPRSTNSTPASPSCSTPTPTPRSTNPCHARAPSVPPPCWLRSATAGPASPTPIPRLPRRRRPLHPCLGPPPHRHLPPGRRQETARRHLRLRRRQLARQRLGKGPIPATRADGKRHPHAERILARSWTHIIWRCWQDRTPYDPARHGNHRRLTEDAA